LKGQLCLAGVPQLFGADSEVPNHI
jgi:hypothetical protein